MRYLIALMFTVTLAGCAGKGVDSACEVFSPAPNMSPSGQDGQRMGTLSGGGSAPTAADQDC